MEQKKPTREDFEIVMKELQKYGSITGEGQWIAIYHPVFQKHHPTAKYLKRYHRRGEHMRKTGRCGR